MNAEDLKPTAADVKQFLLMFTAVCAAIWVMQRFA